MPTAAINGVIGLDGIVPIFNPEGNWHTWGLHEVYTGQTGENKYVPKVRDYVIDTETYTTYIVEHLDPITLIPTLREIRPANMSYSMSVTDVLFGVGPGTTSDTYRVYIDKSVTPYVMAVDARLKITGSMSSYAKIFKGADLTSGGNVISKVFDSSNNYISDNIPLELVAIDSHVNYAVKAITVCHTTENLVDAEIVTAVIYNDRGHVVSKRQLLVENTSFIRSVNVSKKYVTHISVNCPFMSPTVDNLIEFPLNIPINALNLMGTVHYSDGSTFTSAVDGTKFKMHGVDQYLSSIIGQKVDLVLSYALGSDETAYAGVGVEGKYVTEAYSLMTINPNVSYSVKLYGYPVWVSSAVGYSMRWWLMNLDRNVSYDVTPYVRFDTITGAFNPKGYGLLQRKNVSINLRDISGAFKPFVHTQIVDIVLNNEPNVGIEPWIISLESNAARPMYGAGLIAKKITNVSVNLSSGITTYDEWLTRVYKHTFPLLNPANELYPMTPTHFVVDYNGFMTEFVIADWDKDLNIATSLTLYKNVNIKFIKRTVSGDMQLSMASMVIKP
jgi:hypothetical protein